MVVDDGSAEDTYAVRAGSNLTATVLFPGALGDLVLVLPTLRHLRRRHQDLRLVLAVDRRWLPIARIAAAADEVAALDGPEVAAMLGGGPAPSWWGRAQHAYAWMGAGDPEVRGTLARHARRLTVARVVRDDGPVHAALDYAVAAGWHATWDDVVAGSTLRAAPRPGPPNDPRDTLVVHRGAGAAAKRWSLEGFAHVAAWWRRRGGRVVDLRGPAEEGLPPLPGAVPIATTIAELPAVLAATRAFVGCDSGPAHVAGAVGAAGVVVFRSTRAGRWRPASPRLVPVGPPAPHARNDRVDPRTVVRALNAVLRTQDGARDLDSIRGGV